MTRMGIALLVALLAVLLVPAARAQGPQDTHGDLPKRDVHPAPDSAAPAPARAWPQVPGVTPVQAAQLIDQIAATLAQNGEGSGLEALLAIEKELARQTQSVKSAYQASLGGEDVDQLFHQVFEGTPDADPQALQRLASAFETLYIQFGQFMNARFLVANRGGVAVYGSGEANRSVEASAIAQAAEQHVAAYQAGINQSVATLRRLVSLETKR